MSTHSWLARFLLLLPLLLGKQPILQPRTNVKNSTLLMATHYPPFIERPIYRASLLSITRDETLFKLAAIRSHFENLHQPAPTIDRGQTLQQPTIIRRKQEKRKELLLKISSLRIHPICASLGLTRFTSTCFFLPTKLTRTTFYSSTSGRNHRRSRKFHPWTCKTTSFHLSGNRTAEGTNSDKYIILMRADSSRDGSRITRSFE